MKGDQPAGADHVAVQFAQQDFGDRAWQGGLVTKSHAACDFGESVGPVLVYQIRRKKNCV